MRVLVTGASGFVGAHTVRALQHIATVHTLSRSPQSGPDHHCVDLLDSPSLHAVVKCVRPDVLVHLAAVSQVRGESVSRVYDVNVHASVVLAEALWACRPDARLLAVSTGYVHGETPSPAGEMAPLCPIGPYASSKAEMERALRWCAAGRDLCIVRPFNHTGPGQPAGYAVSSFLETALAARAGRVDCIDVGDLSAVRDLSDVRDLADGLRLLCQQSAIPPTLQVCSGRARSMGEVLQLVLQQVGGRALQVPIQASGRSVLRQNVGQPKRARALGIGTRPLATTLLDMLRALSREDEGPHA